MARESRYKNIEELQKKRTSLVAELKEQGMFPGMKANLTKLYTSSGHFIFELLQNAEDVFATTVTFKLEHDKLIFEHNGTRSFDMKDIDSITNYGDSTKVYEEGNSIGKFGIGFKSVFEYTAAPEIHSTDYDFCIEELFIPRVIPSLNNYDTSKTIIILPFNGQKDARTCFLEIKYSFEKLKATVLLFLRNISEINCIYETTQIKINRLDSYSEDNCPQKICRLQRIVTDNKEIKKETTPLYYKRLFKEISFIDENQETKKITIAIAFKIVCTKDDKKWKIQPLYDNETKKPKGRIYAFFPCDSEQRRFCFHIHAPFALKPDREKLREDPSNNKIIEEIGTLLCESMKELKTEGLVDLDLYKTLPNENDDTDLDKYLIIRSKIENFFLNNPYILMADGTYQEPRNKYIGLRNIQDLLSDKDLEIVISSEKQKSFWVKNPMRNHRDYNFLISLKVREYNLADYLSELINLHNHSKQLYDQYINSLEERGAEWFAKFYSLMYSSWSAIVDQCETEDIRSLNLCYCEDNKLHPFDECYLSCEIKDLEGYKINCVNPDCFKKSYTEANISSFLSNYLYVQEFDESDLVTDLCQKFDKSQDKKIDFIKLLYEFYQKDNSVINIYKHYKILMSENGKWAIPENFYIPEELNTRVKNISIYFDFYNTKTSGPVYKISPDYITLFADLDELNKFTGFLIRLGCDSNIPVYNANVGDNPNWSDIADDFPDSAFYSGNRYPTNKDYTIKYFDEFLKRPANEAVFELLISALNSFGTDFIKCTYSPAQKYQPKKYASQITCSLRSAKWFIQEDNGKIYFVKPEDANKSKIPSKYKELISSYPLDYWLREMNFGVQEEIKNEQYEKENDIISSVVGLNDNSIGILRQFNNSDLSSEVKEEILNNINQYLQSCLSESMYRENDFDINRLNEKSEEAYNNANDMEYEDRKRSVRIIDPKKALAEPFLRQVCVNEDGDILCQVCRNRLPFKKPNGQEYFEKVQLFPKSLIKKELKENYIACCPLCSAKMKVFYSHNSEAQNSLFKQIAYSQESIVSFPVQLDKDSDITFSKRHIVALRKMIELSQKE